MNENNSNVSFSANNVDEAIINVMENLLKHGNKVESAKNSNNFDSTIEIENFQFALTNPLDRVAINPNNSLEVVSAVGRFAWLVAGNDRLEDIVFYQNKVRDYTDDGLTVPGSNYGKRIFNPQPGIDQIKNVIKLLEEDPNSRRAIIPIWAPHDSSRLKSKDISCAFGISFLIRNNELHMTLIMRSNHALRLLSVNIFEFTLIGEIVARELGIKFGKYIHYSISMHISEQDIPKVEKWPKLSTDLIQPETRLSMPEMPASPPPLEQAKLLAKLEASLRNGNVLLDSSHINEHLANAKKELNSPYWFEFFKVLCIGALLHAKQMPETISLSKELEPYFKGPVISFLKYLEQTQKVSDETLVPYFENENTEKFAIIKKAFTPDDDEIPSIIDNLQNSVQKFEDEKHVELTGKEYRELEKKYLNKPIVAARSTGKDDDAEDRRKISQKEIYDDIKDVLSKRNKK